MLYQLAIYALSQNAHGHATILYPTTNEYAFEERIQIRDTISGKGCAQVILRPLNLLHLFNLISGHDTAVTKRERETYAQKLAFGR
jgi:hypothetical protein